MREERIRDRLTNRVKEMFRETNRIEKNMGECFWTARGVRQGCPLTLLLFNIMIANLKKEMRKVGWEDIKIGRRECVPWHTRTT